jgi:hypothetical protein
MRKGFLISEETSEYLVIYEEGLPIYGEMCEYLVIYEEGSLILYMRECANI